jgi:hypothetical protein
LLEFELFDDENDFPLFSFVQNNQIDLTNKDIYIIVIVSLKSIVEREEREGK